MNSIVEREMVAEIDRPSLLSWGAVLAGLVLVVASSWLMFLLGSAIGVSIADVTDMEAVGDGLSIWAIVWLLLTSLIAFFLGGLLTARLTGKHDHTVGMLHGITLWSVATVLAIFLGYVGVSGLIQTGQSLVKGAVSAGSSVGSALVAGAGAAGEAGETLANSSLMTDVQAQLKRKASEILSKSGATAGAADVSQQDVSQAIGEVDSETMKTVATRLLSGDTEGAKQAFTGNTNLSAEQLESLVTGISSDLQQRIQQAQGQTGADNSTLLTDLQTELTQKANDILGEAVQASGATNSPEVNQEDITQAIEQMNADTLKTVGMNLLRGDTEGAKNALAVDTSLSEEQINAIVDGISEEVQQKVDAIKAEFNKQMETVSSYTQAVLWTVFISAALGLLVSILGGWLGADTVKRLFLVARETTVS
jgi:hypothetical protein